MTHRVLVCGSRVYQNRRLLRSVLDELLSRHGDELLIIQGGAPGADSLAREWAVDHHVDHVTLYAKWKSQPRAIAGPRRNSRMLRLNPHECLAFHEDPGLGRGTQDTVRKFEAWFNARAERYIG